MNSLSLESHSLLSKTKSAVDDPANMYSVAPAVVRRRRERRAQFLFWLAGLTVVLVVFMFVALSLRRQREDHAAASNAASLRATATSSFGPTGWAVKKFTHVTRAGQANATLAFLSTYLMAPVEPESNLGCGAARIKLSASLPWNGTLTQAAVQFVDAPVFHDLPADAQGTAGADFWVNYFEQQHGDLAVFNAWMHGKVQLFTPDLAPFVQPLLRDSVPVMTRTSVDRDGASVAHCGVQVQGIIFELVGPLDTLPDAAATTASAWSGDECPAAHELPASTSLADLTALVAAHSSVDQTDALRPGLPRLVVVALSTTSGDPLGDDAATRHAHLHELTGLSPKVLVDRDECTVVDSAWGESPGFVLREVRNSAAPSGDLTLAAYDAFVQSDHAAFVQGHTGSWDRFLDQHVGLWYAGDDVGACNARASALRRLLHASETPFAERAQSDAHLFYAGYDGPFAYEYQFAACDADRADAPQECGCVSSNNYAVYFNETGRSSCTGSAQPEHWEP